MRASVNLLPDAEPARIVALAVEAERLGYARCWVYDEGLTARDVYVTLAAIACNTERVMVGTGITNPFTRHPGSTAAAIATLDELSGGRAFLGLGAGGGLTLGPMRIERHRPITAVREMVESLRGLFAGETVDRDGEPVRFRNATLGFARPDIEIWLAGRGPRMLRLGGEVADGFVLSYVHKDTIGDSIALLGAGARGRAQPPRVAYSTMVCTTDRDLEAAKSHLTFRLVDSPQPVKEMLGVSPADVAALRAALGEGGPRGAAHLVREEWLHPFVIVGTPAQCRSELAALMDEHGIDEFLLPVQEADTGGELMEAAAAIVPG